MKMISWLMTVVMTGALALAAQGSELDQLKAELIGQSMGGREKCWKFQSLDQIKDLAIKNKSEDSHKRVYTLALQLQAAKGAAKYSAEARVEYAKDAKAVGGWKLKHVGLLSLAKME